MPRRKITLELKGLRTPRERMWSAMLGYDARSARSFTASMVEDKAFPLDWSTIDDYLDSLEVAGYIECISRKQRTADQKFAAKLYRIIKRQADAPRVDKFGRSTAAQGQGVAAMWRMAKVLGSFDYRALAAAASQGGVMVMAETAGSYCRALARSGHFRVSAPPTGKTGGGRTASRYVMANDTGPFAPAITREKSVFDRNTGTLQPLRSPQEVCDALG